MDLIQKANKLGYKHYTEFTIKELDKLPLENLNKQIEYYFIQKWLREVHEVHVQIIVNYEQRNQTRSYRVGIIYITQLSDRRFLQTTFIRPENDKNEFIEFSTYEEALEDGLFKALQLIQ